MDKEMIQKIKMRIIKEVEQLGYSINENNVIYDFKANSKYNIMIFVVDNDLVPILVFEYYPKDDSIKKI